MPGAVIRHVAKKGAKKLKDKLNPPTAAQAAKAAKHAERLEKIDSHSRSAKTIGQDIADDIKGLKRDMAKANRQMERRLVTRGAATAAGSASGAAAAKKRQSKKKKTSRGRR